MADDIIERCSGLNIDDEENEIADLGGVQSIDTKTKSSLMLVVRVVSNLDALKECTINQIWSLNRNMIVRAILLFSNFSIGKISKKFLRGRPWCFDQKLLVLNEIKGEAFASGP